MKNLEQERAESALIFYRDKKHAPGGSEGGDVIRGLPALIINNGLLATLAFAKQKGGGHADYMNEICRFLAEKRGIISSKTDRLEDYVSALCELDSFALQRAVSEALAYLAYLKRFMPHKKEGAGNDSND